MFFSFLGSKNVHLMIGKVSDLDLYTDGRYQIAKQVGSATLDLISRLHPSKLEILLSFLHHTKSTAVFEVLQPTYQHVVDLTYLGSTPELKFITWTSAFKEEMEIESLCSIRPDAGIQFAQRLGMTTVKSDLISVEDFQERFDSIRKGKLFHYWKQSKISHSNFLILAFSTNFCTIKIDLSGNTVWPQALGFQKLAK